jgi:hypothetical protein
MGMKVGSFFAVHRATVQKIHCGVGTYSFFFQPLLQHNIIFVVSTGRIALSLK